MTTFTVAATMFGVLWMSLEKPEARFQRFRQLRRRNEEGFERATRSCCVFFPSDQRLDHWEKETFPKVLIYAENVAQATTSPLRTRSFGAGLGAFGSHQQIKLDLRRAKARKQICRLNRIDTIFFCESLESIGFASCPALPLDMLDFRHCPVPSHPGGEGRTPAESSISIDGNNVRYDGERIPGAAMFSDNGNSAMGRMALPAATAIGPVGIILCPV